MTSVIIPAHNEEAVLARSLHNLLDHAEPGEFEIIVVPNGCTDGTADVARSFPGVTVLELRGSSKTQALNAGEALATGFPRLYLDADIRLRAADLRALAAAVAGPAGGTVGMPVDKPGAGSAAPTTGSVGDAGTPGRPLLAAAPRRVVDTSGSDLLVRAYYAVNRRLPAYRNALFGRGAIALSATGRARFGRFPESFADDLYLDSLFAPGEKGEISAAAVVVAPARARDLVRRLGRVRAANAALRTVEGRVPPVRRGSWLVDVVLPRPWLLPAGACYLALTVLAGMSARRAGTRDIWGRGRDDSSRTAGAAR